MKMITTILIEDEITEDYLAKQKMIKEMYAQDNPEWEDDGSIERGFFLSELRKAGFADEDSKVMVEIRYED
jgi:hypothetical protein